MPDEDDPVRRMVARLISLIMAGEDRMVDAKPLFIGVARRSASVVWRGL
jgi:hypothetical protein